MRDAGGIGKATQARSRCLELAVVHRAAKNAAQVPAALKAPAYALPIPPYYSSPLASEVEWEAARFEEAVPHRPYRGKGIIFVPYKGAGT